MKRKNQESPAKKNEASDEILNLKTQLARALADYDNLSKRTEEEKSIWIRVAIQNVVQKLLPILDTFETAQVHLKDSGLAIAISQLKAVFTEEGLVEISPKAGDEFDPELHEAIDSVEEPKNAGKIAEVYTKGWRFNEGAVVRYSKVRVYK